MWSFVRLNPLFVETQVRILPGGQIPDCQDTSEKPSKEAQWAIVPFLFQSRPNPVQLVSHAGFTLVHSRSWFNVTLCSAWHFVYYFAARPANIYTDWRQSHEAGFSLRAFSYCTPLLILISACQDVSEKPRDEAEASNHLWPQCNRVITFPRFSRSQGLFLIQNEVW